MLTLETDYKLNKMYLLYICCSYKPAYLVDPNAWSLEDT